MGVNGGGSGLREETVPFTPALLPELESTAKQNRPVTAAQRRRLSAGPRSPGDRLEQTGVFSTSGLSAPGLPPAVPGPRAVNKLTKISKHS